MGYGMEDGTLVRRKTTCHHFMFSGRQLIQRLHLPHTVQQNTILRQNPRGRRENSAPVNDLSFISFPVIGHLDTIAVQTIHLNVLVVNFPLSAALLCSVQARVTPCRIVKSRPFHHTVG